MIAIAISTAIYVVAFMLWLIHEDLKSIKKTLDDIAEPEEVETESE